MSEIYGRDLDLNLLRVFVVTAEQGSVTAAASRLYLTQPAVSAALKRLATAIGAPLFVRRGRGLALTARGTRLLHAARPHLASLVSAALAPSAFDPRQSDRTIRLGLSDSSAAWLLPALLRALEREAPRMRILVLPVQFRTVADALVTGSVDLAITVADELPAGIARETLFHGGFVCLHDPRRSKLSRTLTRERYLAEDHVVVSYNGDLRGVVEDALGLARRVRVSVPTFHEVGAVVDGSRLLATVPEVVAREIRALRPHLATQKLPFALDGTPMELLMPLALADDDAVRFIRAHIVRIASRFARRCR